MGRRGRDALLAAVAMLILGGAIAALIFLPGEKPAPAPVSPNAPASTDLIEHPKTWDGQVIPFRGEAIGEAMIRGDYAWLHLNDDAYYLKNVEEGAGLAGYNTGMAVYIPAALAQKVQIFGDYKHEGDIVQVDGTFNAACAAHGGDMDIHAVSLRMVTPGHHAIDAIRPWKVVLALVLSLLALMLWQVETRSRGGRPRSVVTRTEG